MNNVLKEQNELREQSKGSNKIKWIFIVLHV